MLTAFRPSPEIRFEIEIDFGRSVTSLVTAVAPVIELL